MEMEYETTLCFTGHRPESLYGYDPLIEGNRKLLMKLRAIIERMITVKGITTFISGMALGIDMWAARIVIVLREKYPHIKLVCAVPCANHPARWKEESKREHAEILREADHVYYVSDEPYTKWCMHVRDKWMVDNARLVIAVWNGCAEGGTAYTVKYADKRQRTIIRLNPDTYEIKIGVK